MTKTLTFGAFILSLALTGSFFGLASAQETSEPQATTAVLLTEDFNYPDGSLLSANGWMVHSDGGANPNPLTATPPNLSYTGYSSSGNSVGFATSGEDVHRTFAGQSTGSVYAAFLVNVSEASLDPAGGYFVHFGPDPISTTFRGRVFAKKNEAGSVAFGISKSSTNAATIVFTPFSYALNTTYLLVLKYTVVDGDSNDTVSLTINPSLTGDEPAATVTATDAASDIVPASFALRQGTAATSPTVRVDAIRVATTWEEALNTKRDAPSDFNGDGKTDFAVIRPGPGGASGQFGWWILLNGPNTVSFTSWGLNSDFHVPADFDGDGADDIAIWRPASNRMSGFWIIRSSDGTAYFTPFGDPGDDPWVVADYTGDGKDDPAIYRPGATDTDQSFFWYDPSSGPYVGQHVAGMWGLGSDFAVPGDYNGDGMADFTVVRGEGSPAKAMVYTLTNTNNGVIGEVTATSFGVPTDFFVPGDWDGDGKTDLAISRAQGSNILWVYRPSSGGSDVWLNWGRTATDFEAPGDYDGDGRMDHAIWRDAGTPSFIVRLSSGGVVYQPWGSSGDIISIWAVK